jgi:hypothetical protein
MSVRLRNQRNPGRPDARPFGVSPKTSRRSALWVQHRRMDLALPVPLLEDLHALAAMSADIHGDICTVHDPECPDGFGCTCGVPRLLRSLAELLPLPEGAQAPFRPAWVPSVRAA